MKMKKKASILDITTLAIFLFIFALFIILGNKSIREINTEFQQTSALSNTSKSHISTLSTKYTNIWDNIFPMVMVFVAIAIAIGAYFLDLHPIFYLPSIFIIMITIMISGIFGNAYADIKDEAEIKSDTDLLDMINFIFNNYVIIILVLSFIVVIVLYAKNKGAEG